MKKNKICFIIILIIILASFSISAANHNNDLRIKVNQRPLNLNPIYAANKTEIMINQQIFGKLLRFNQNKEPVVNLAKSWELNNTATVFSFELKKDVYFQPYKIKGKEISAKERKVTAEDWKWSFEYLASPQNKSPHAELFKKVKGYENYRQGKKDELSGIRVLDDYHLEIELNEAYAPFIYNLLKAPAVVMPKKAVLNRDKKFSLSPVGTGAFEQEKFTYNQITLVKNNDYWENNYRLEKLSEINKIEFNFDNKNNFKDDYKKFDFYQLNSEELKNYQRQSDYYSGYQLEKIANNSYYYTALNFNSNLKNNIKISNIKAIFNKNFIENNISDDLNNNNFEYATVNSDRYFFLDRIYFQSQKNLSVSNSNKDEQYNLSLTAAVNNKEKALKIAEFMKKKLNTNGIDLNIKKYDWVEYLTKLKNNNLDSQLFLMNYNYKNKFEFIADNFHSDSSKNYFNYKNSRVDNLIDYLKLESNQKAREQAYEIIEDILLQNHPFILLFKGSDNYLVRDELVNNYELKNIFLDDNF